MAAKTGIKVRSRKSYSYRRGLTYNHCLCVCLTITNLLLPYMGIKRTVPCVSGPSAVCSFQSYWLINSYILSTSHRITVHLSTIVLTICIYIKMFVSASVRVLRFGQFYFQTKGHWWARKLLSQTQATLHIISLESLRTYNYNGTM